jgi:glutamyl/glutaminyl-tRNA synthetase
MNRTRFRPTANGRLHLGGALVARHNYQYARAKAGEFVLIVDDVVPFFKWGPNRSETSPHRMAECRAGFLEDLEWLGIPPGSHIMASDLQIAHEAAARTLGIERPPWCGWCLDRIINTPTGSNTCASYHPWLVAGRVSDDYELGVTEFTRGADLYGECQLYDWFSWQLYGAGRRVMQEYTATVVAPETQTPCSKSAGTGTIAEYRAAGIKPEAIHEVLDSLTRLPGTGYGSYNIGYMQVPPEKWHLLGIEEGG